jgi:hypothetical protein
MRAFLRTIAVFLAAPSVALAVTAYQATQNVTDVELQRYIYEMTFPSWCGDATVAAHDMRVNATTDPQKLHAVMKADIDHCANTSWVQERPAVWNTAVFSAASAALLAARYEPPAAALPDAASARDWSAIIAGFTHQPGAGRPGPGMNMPSMYRTNAGRINKDAIALISAIQSSAATPAGSPAASAGSAAPQAQASAQSSPHP